MPTIAFPSPEFPGLAGLRLDHPDGWYPLPDVAQYLAVAKAVPDGQFRPNVIGSVQRMRKGTAMQQAIAELQQRTAGLRDYAHIGEEQLLISGWPGYRTEGSFIDPGAGTLVQAIRLAVVDRGPVEDLVQITGTCHATQADEVWEQIRAIQESVQIIAS